MNNSCSYDCKYCQNSTSCKNKKASYTPEELDRVFTHVQKTLDVNALFLSSGISKNADSATEKMIDAVKLVRQHFKGYIHFKVLPGTSYHLIKEASQYANRMSINIEAPNSSVLSELSTVKDYKTDILRRQSWLAKLNVNQTTQMMINDMATDKDVLKMVNWEYNSFNLKRIYYSAFRPVQGTPLENEKPGSLLRQNHLYNVDFLMRTYNFKIKEFNSIMPEGMLPKEDPKLAMAKANFDRPIDINDSTYEELIRVPGIGPDTAKKILSTKEKITSYSQLHNFGGWIKRAKPFIEVDGKRQKMLCEF